MAFFLLAKTQLCFWPGVMTLATFIKKASLCFFFFLPLIPLIFIVLFLCEHVHLHIYTYISWLSLASIIKYHTVSDLIEIHLLRVVEIRNPRSSFQLIQCLVEGSLLPGLQIDAMSLKGTNVSVREREILSILKRTLIILDLRPHPYDFI